jgi:metallophosphoesterase superfamily enzyme
MKERIIKELFTNPNRSNTNIAREILPNGLHRDIEKLRKQVGKLRNSEVVNNNYYTNDTYLPDDEIYTEPMIEALQKSGYNVTGTNDYICNKNNMIKLPNNVLVIPDLHLPFSTDQHLQHCVKMKEKYKCGKVIFIGDIVDNHYSSFHTANPDELSAGQELDLVKLQIKKWYSYFPEATWVMGNHDCYSADTEVLTDNGWKNITEVTLEDKVAVESNGINYENPTHLIHTKSDEWYEIETPYSKQIVTPNHDCLLSHNGELIKKKAKDITTDDLKYFIECSSKGNIEYDITDEILRLLVQVITDATLVNYEKYNAKSKKRVVQFKLSKERKIQRLTELLEKGNYNYTLKLCKKGELNKLQPYYIRLYGDIARQIFTLLDNVKGFPTWFRNLSRRQVELVIEELSYTDGHKNINNISWNTINKSDVDIMQEICVTNGYKFKWQPKENTTGFANGKLQYVCSILPYNINGTKYSIERHKKIYDKDFYCLTMPSGNFITRVDGKTCFSGNCIPQRKFAEAKLSKQWLKGFNEVLGVNWDIKKSLVYNGVYYVHGEAMEAKAMAGKIGMPVVQGHRHSSTYIQYLSQKIWAVQTGICFNKYTYASDYAKESTETWVETVIVVEDKTPHIIAM